MHVPHSFFSIDSFRGATYEIGMKKIALVTGSTSNIGKAVAERFSRDGFDVVVTSRHVDEARAVAAALPNPGRAFALDFADPVQIDATHNGSPFNVQLVRALHVSGTIFAAGTTTTRIARILLCAVGVGGDQRRVVLLHRQVKRLGRRQADFLFQAHVIQRLPQNSQVFFFAAHQQGIERHKAAAYGGGRWR